ncbi:MAG: hypothetical protein AB7O38_26615 [Pirellulaceae bacterium]
MRGHKGGAPAGNGNAVRHGLTAGTLPKGAAYIARSTGQFRTALEGAIVERKGEISLHDAAVIQTAIRWERHALLVQRWLRRELADLSPDQRLAFSRDVARASAERDKCLKILGLDRDARSDIFDALYSETLPTATTTQRPAEERSASVPPNDAPVASTADAVGLHPSTPDNDANDDVDSAGEEN